MRNPLIAGNWKMHGSRQSVNYLLTQLLTAMKAGYQSTETIEYGVECVVFPPFVFLAETEQLLTGSTLAWGGQNLCHMSEGAYTGEISAAMLQDYGCRYVIVGHSERRLLFGESDTLVAQKFLLALRSGLRPILCVGETLAQRQSGVTHEVVQQQLAAVFKLLNNESDLIQLGFDKAVIAYEPVWAIGTGQVATPQMAQEVHLMIRNQLRKFDVSLTNNMRIIYGGSVKAENATALFAEADIDGALVGGASLQADQFLEIINLITPRLAAGQSYGGS